ncbi:hypothetical protein TB2_004547 [Malus domestica]
MGLERICDPISHGQAQGPKPIPPRFNIHFQQLITTPVVQQLAPYPKLSKRLRWLRRGRHRAHRQQHSVTFAVGFMTQKSQATLFPKHQLCLQKVAHDGRTYPVVANDNSLFVFAHLRAGRPLSAADQADPGSDW